MRASADNGDRHVPTRKRDWIFNVSAKFIRHAKVSPGARCLFVLIKSFEGKDGKLPYPGLDLLADKMGRNRDTIQAYMRELEKAGHAEKKRPRKSDGTFGSVHYELSWEPHRKKPALEKPAVEKPAVVEPATVEPATENSATKTSHSKDSPSLTISTAEDAARTLELSRIAATSADSDDLVEKLKPFFPRNNVRSEHNRFLDYRQKINRTPTAEDFVSWMAKARPELKRLKSKQCVVSFETPQREIKCPDADQSPEKTAKFLSEFEARKGRKFGNGDPAASKPLPKI